MRKGFTKRYHIIGVLVLLTVIFVAFIYEFISNPDEPLRAGTRYGSKSPTQYTQGDAILPITVIYVILLLVTIFYYQKMLMN